MMPVIFRVPWIDRDIPGYGFMMMIGFLVAIWWAARRAARSGANPDVVLNAGLLALLTGVAGSRFMYVVHYWESFKHRGGFLDVAFAVLNISQGGLEFYGGLIAAVVCVTVYLWRRGHSLRWYMDIVAPSLALGLAFGRMGCFLNGCCYGAVCDQPWAVKFPFGSFAQRQQWKDKHAEAQLPEQLIVFNDSGVGMPITRESLRADNDEIAEAETEEATLRKQIAVLDAKVSQAPPGQVQKQHQRELEFLRLKLKQASLEFQDIRTQMRKYGMSADELRALTAEHRSMHVHPTQLYASAAAVMLALLLNAFYWRRTRDGQVICALLLIQPVTRWILEVIRADNPHDTLGALTISQFLGLCMSVVALLGFWILRRLPPRSPAAALWEPEEEEAPAPKKTKEGAKQ